MKAMKVVSTYFNEPSQRIEVVREITNDDDTIEYNGLSFPVDKLEWLSATLEVDNVDDLIDVAMYESMIDSDDELQDVVKLRQKRGSKILAIKNKLGPMRANGNKANIKTKLLAAGLHSRYVDAVDNDPIDEIKKHSKIDPDRVVQKRELIRAARRGEIVPATPSGSRDAKNLDKKPNRPVKQEVKLPTINLHGRKRVT
jgi:hypothetical protein